jgi:tRNA U34 5-methylaminomethyl-2-thiouridine-forming methyltransferase MnmC
MTERIDQHDAAFTPAPAPAPPAKLWTREALRAMNKETLAQMVRAHPAFVYSKTPPIRWRHQELVDTLIQMQAAEIGRLSA